MEGRRHYGLRLLILQFGVVKKQVKNAFLLVFAIFEH